MKRSFVWLFLVLAVWGVPSLFFWIGIGAGTNLYLEQSVQKLQESVQTSIEDASERIDPEVFFQTFWDSGARELLRSPIQSSAHQRAWKGITDQFASGSVRVFRFDHRGRLLHQEDWPDPGEIQAFFDYIRKPLFADFIDPETCLKENSFFCRTNRLLGLSLKTRGPGTLIGKRKPSWIPLTDPDWSYFQWKDGQAEGFLGGLVVLISRDFLPRDFFLKAALKASGPSSPRLGYWVDAAEFRPPDGVSAEEFKDLITRFYQAPSSRFQTGKHLAEGRYVGGNALLLAVAPRPHVSSIVFPVIFAAYAFLSFRFLSFLYGVLVCGAAFRLSLERKLAFLFLLGFVFPLGVSAAISLLYIREKDAEILSEHRQASFQILDGIDASFERFLASRQLEYQKLCRDCSQGKISLDRFKKIIENRMRAATVNEFALTGAQGEILELKFQPLSTEIMQVFPMSPAQRRKYLRYFWENGMSLSFSRIKNILFQEDPEKRVTPTDSPSLRYTPDQKSNMRKGLTSVAREVMSFVNSQLEGSQPPKAAGIPVEGLMSNFMLKFVAGFKTHIGSIFELANSDYIVYHFSDVLRDRNGRGKHLVWISNLGSSLQRECLDRYFTKEIPESLRPSIKAAGMLHTPVQCFPDLDDVKTLYPLQRQVNRNGQAIGWMRKVINGSAHEICFRRGQNLNHFILFHFTPVSLLEKASEKILVRVATFIAGACLFGCLLAWLFIQNFLVPLSALAAGVRAIRHKQFEHRIPALANDELGLLCQEFNKVMEHMHEMEAASIIQKNLYPQSDLVAGNFLFRGKNLMNQAIGGDYYDFIPLPDGRWAFALGDVSGHGLSAALVTAMAKAGFTLLLPQHLDDPMVVLKKVSDTFMVILQRKKMMTCLLGILDPLTGRTLLFNAGQCSPCIFKEGGKGEYLDMPSSPLGISKRNKFFSAEIQLNNQSLLLFTDGLVELESDEKLSLGYDDFKVILQNVFNENGSICLEKVFDQVRVFTRNAAWPDDATALVVSFDRPVFPTMDSASIITK